MQTAYVNGIRRFAPDSWNEIKRNRKLLVWTLSLFFQSLTPQQLLNLVAFRFLKIGGFRQKRVERLLEKHPDSKEAQNVAENLFRGGEAFDFIVKQQLEVKENLFPRIFRFRRLHAAVSVLTNFGVWEYALAEAAFFNFVETDEQRYLDELIAIAFRRKKLFWFIRKSFKKSDGDKRVIFNENTYKNQIKRISKLPIAVKWLIFRWFSHQRELIIDAHIYTYKNRNGEGGGGTWADTILAMSSVGDEDKTANTKLSIILRRIDNENKAAEEFKRKNKQKDVDS
jgi:hypothetical protein